MILTILAFIPDFFSIFPINYSSYLTLLSRNSGANCTRELNLTMQCLEIIDKKFLITRVSMQIEEKSKYNWTMYTEAMKKNNCFSESSCPSVTSWKNLYEKITSIMSTLFVTGFCLKNYEADMVELTRNCTWNDRARMNRTIALNCTNFAIDHTKCFNDYKRNIGIAVNESYEILEFMKGQNGINVNLSQAGYEILFPFLLVSIIASFY